jgi:hypothetical protein
VKRVERGQPGSGPITTVTSYYVRSSVLGRVVTELDGQGAKKLTYVYSNGAVVAKQESGQVGWVYADPVTNSVREADAGGHFASRQEFDPLGNDAPLVILTLPIVTSAYAFLCNDVNRPDKNYSI